MPRVPEYDVGQVRVQNLPNARLQNYATAEVLGGGIGRGLEAVAGVVGQIAKQEQEKADTAQLLEADRRLSEWEVQRLYTPETGLLNRRGKDALGIPDEAMPELDKLSSEIEGGLNDRVKLRFRQLANGRRGDIERQLFRHVSAQSDVILKAETEAYEQTALQNIGVHAGDAERVAVETERLWAAKSAALDRMGATPEVIRAERDAMMSAVHSRVLDQFIARNDLTAAVEYFDANRDGFGAQADEAARTVREARYVIQETEESDRIMASLGAGPAAIREARKIEDPFLRERVESRIDREAARQERLQNEYERNLREHAYQQLESTGTVPTDPKLRAALASQPGVLADMERRARQIAEGVEPVRDDARWYALIDEAATNPAEFAKRDLMSERSKMDDSAFNQLVQLQAQTRRGGAEAKELTGYRTTKQVVDDTLSASGLDPSPKPGEAAKRITSFRRALDEQVILWKAQNGGKEPGTADVQSMADRLLKPWVQEVNWGFDQSRFAFEAPKPPRDPKSRTAGQVYSTPRGALRWTGTGWAPLAQETE